MRLCRCVLLLLLFGVSWYGAANAQAQEAIPSWCGDDRDCASRCKEALQLSRNRQWAAAIVAYQAAYDLKPYPPFLYNIARLHQKSGNLAEAARYYQLYLDSPPENYPAQRETARLYLALVQGLLLARPPPPAAAPLSAAVPLSAAPLTAKLSIAKDPPPESRKVPIERRWWMWSAVGVAVAGAAVGIGLSVYAIRPTAPNVIVFVPFH